MKDIQTSGYVRVEELDENGKQKQFIEEQTLTTYNLSEVCLRALLEGLEFENIDDLMHKATPEDYRFLGSEMSKKIKGY